MPPSLTVPTDNIYKFMCLFGLALILSGIIAVVTTYTSSLDRKIAYAESVMVLEAKMDRTKTEEETLSARLVDRADVLSVSIRWSPHKRSRSADLGLEGSRDGVSLRRSLG